MLLYTEFPQFPALNQLSLFNETNVNSFLNSSRITVSLLTLSPLLKSFFDKKLETQEFLPKNWSGSLKGLTKQNVNFEILESLVPCLKTRSKPGDFSEECLKSATSFLKTFDRDIFYQAFTKKTLFSEILKIETSSIHRAVEQHAFVKSLLDGTLTNAEYYSHLVDLQHIYETLESAIKVAITKEPRLNNIHFQNLERSEMLKKDLRAEEFKGLKNEPSNAAIEYGKRLQFISEQYPILLISHAYTRYLGDLSGGMILKSYIQNKWPNAVNFFNFDALLEECSLTRFYELKNLFKAKMNSIELTPKELDDSVKETDLAFTYAERLFSAAHFTKQNL